MIKCGYGTGLQDLEPSLNNCTIQKGRYADESAKSKDKNRINKTTKKPTKTDTQCHVKILLLHTEYTLIKLRSSSDPKLPQSVQAAITKNHTVWVT